MGFWFGRSTPTRENVSNPQIEATDATVSAKVGKRGGVYISPQQITELPEVKEMRRLAESIVKRDLLAVRK